MKSDETAKLKFRSKISWWVLAVVTVPVIGILVWLLVADWKLLLWEMIWFIPYSLLIYNIYSSTYYTIDGDMLRVKCGVLINDRIRIANILSVSKSRSLLSSPALSTDRIELRLRRHSSVIISPENESEFVRRLLDVTPDIEVKSLNLN